MTVNMESIKTAVPKHIAIILDGNRRFAKRLMLKPWQGHEWGAKKVEKILDWCREYGAKELTLYCFSIENFHKFKFNCCKLVNFSSDYANYFAPASLILWLIN